jgi:uncharacterized protein
MKEEERIRCPVHDLIAFKKSNPDDILLWGPIQTKPMQRLRRIKQLGFSEFVYPGATHSRFSHVVGAMQMARRMLSVLEKNQSVIKEADPDDKTATLAASLLHDIGHGPYSHVFEEISDHFDLEKAHETYTSDLLQTDEIKKLLDSRGIFEKTKNIFSKEPGYNIFTAIISSEMDCDRLDFLCRDRLFTGVRSAVIDLEWLFDSLRIETVPIGDGDATAPSFVFTEKGKSVAEEFVIAYVNMYNQVYYHKTTRGVQHLVKDMLVEIISKHSEIPEIVKLPLIRYFNGEANLETFMQLDDSSVLSLAQIVASRDLGDASHLAKRFLSRDVYKCFECPVTETGQVPRQRVKRFREKLREKQIYFIDDVISAKRPKQYDITDIDFIKNILVKRSGVKGLTNYIAVARLYFRNSEDRAAAEEIFRTC